MVLLEKWKQLAAGELFGGALQQSAVFKKWEKLKAQLASGAATEEIMEEWQEVFVFFEKKKRLSADYETYYQETKNAILFLEKLFFYQNQMKSLKQTRSAVLVISRMKGDWTQFDAVLQKLKQEGDTVVVLGDFLSDKKETLVDDVHRALAYAREGVFFLQGERERIALETLEPMQQEALFLRYLPQMLENQLCILLPEQAESSAIPFADYFTNDELPNVTAKQLIGVHHVPDSGTCYYQNEKQRVLGLADYTATRLGY